MFPSLYSNLMFFDSRYMEDAGNDGVHDASADSALLSNAFPELSFHILPRFHKNINMLGCVSLPATSLSPTHPSGQVACYPLIVSIGAVSHILSRRDEALKYLWKSTMQALSDDDTAFSYISS
ncbi:uncharacterized protein [Triticum aestivum]|uniref:uncharacterized protein isoform X1 n=1 Tax=Triticum aestivum TaxID=4565 RepID=UPI001D023B29|nr:uncharacterized protein LOC123145173 isoform X1 [Triticum aestivum]